MKHLNLKFYFLVTLCIGISSKFYAQNEEPKNESFQHVLLFKWNENAEESKKEEVLNLFKELPEKVDGFEKVNIYDVTNSSEEYDIILILEFNSEAVLKIYEAHPDHVLISELAPPLIGGFGFVDFKR